MYLTHGRLLGHVKSQFQYKLKAYIGVFSSIIVVQLIALLFSVDSGSSTSSSDGVQIDIDYFSANTVIGFTMITVLINAIHITTKTFQEDGFIFSTTRLTANLSNVLFLLTVSVFGGMTAMLSSVVVRLGSAIMFQRQVLGASMDISASELFYGMGASIAYMLLVSAIGYVFGSLVQINRLFMFIIPAGLYGVLVLLEDTNGNQIGETVFTFFFHESSFLLLLLKVIVVSTVLFACSLLITNNKEVRQ